jgi:ATP-binding cassette subfamily B protein
MIFGKHINRYYLRYGLWLLLGVLALAMIDVFQLKIPEFYRMVINGMNSGEVVLNGETVAFDMDFLLDEICLPLIIIIVCMAFGRFLWRICFFGSAVKLETDLRCRMFDHAKDLSRQYYQVNKVGNMMSLFTNDLETVQECYGSGIMMFLDAVFLGSLAIFKMFRMDALLTVLAMIPMVFLLLCATIVGNHMMKKWDVRQAAFSDLSAHSTRCCLRTGD